MEGELSMSNEELFEYAQHTCGYLEGGGTGEGLYELVTGGDGWSDTAETLSQVAAAGIQTYCPKQLDKLSE
ncbi:hypothetical protein FM119_04055 [Mycetocola reblochoni REB411]|uniref:DUF732 domain-containing protein n=2 Tax=Mycetocola reblochoni TaxID=331618 RepID=A0A1R4IWD0_9MICO|nr:hypothetical protein FM119_04055 [Mycetocola reblochoni REB411]